MEHSHESYRSAMKTPSTTSYPRRQQRRWPPYHVTRPPNGQRISGERRAEGDERVRCMRVLGGATELSPANPPAMRLTGAQRQSRHDDEADSESLLKSPAGDKDMSYFAICSADQSASSRPPATRQCSESTNARAPRHAYRDREGPDSPGNHLVPPNGQRISGERRAEGDERVRCMRVLGGGLIDDTAPTL